MRITLCKINDDVPVVEFKLEVSDRSYILIPYINDESFTHLYDDLMFVKTKWMTYYLNYMCYDNVTKEPEEMAQGIVEDLVEILEHEIIFRRLMEMGTYKIMCYDM
jgi:hypothetical protein